MKKLLNRQFGYGMNPRLPLLPMSDEKAAVVFSHQHLGKLLALEATLPEPSIDELSAALALK